VTADYAVAAPQASTLVGQIAVEAHWTRVDRIAPPQTRQSLFVGRESVIE
jgi:hypothetical protein